MSTEQLEFNIGEDEEPATVEMNNDGTDAKVTSVEEPPEVEEVPAKGKQAQELDNYSDSVQKRIDKLTARLRETERREQAALEYAKSVQQKASELEQRYHQTDTVRLHETKSRIETQVAALKAVIRQAREEGDIDTETEAQERLASITYDHRRVSEDAAARQNQNEQMELRRQQQAQQVQQQPQQQRRQPDEKAEAWAERNEWYGRDAVLTNAVQGVHYQLVVEEKFDATSDEYYDELDKRMAEYFPEKLGRQRQQNNRTTRSAHPVAPASRSSGINNARRSVKLTPSQVAIAKKLGVPLEEYAKYVKD